LVIICNFHSDTSIAFYLGQRLCQPLRKIEHGMYLRSLIFQQCKLVKSYLYLVEY